MNPEQASNPSSPWAVVRQFYGMIQLLSLDVVAGAIGSGIMVSVLCGYKITPHFLAILGIAVWLIYTLDHLLDARRLGEAASTPRHQFHHRFFNHVVFAWIILAIAGGILVLWKMKMSAIWFGLVMGGFTIAHLGLVKLVGDRTSPFLIKEMGVAMVYAGGVWGLPVLDTGKWGEPFIYVSFAQFLLLALINLLLFSYFEYETDEQDKHTSFVRAIGKRAARNFIGFLLLILPISELVILPFDTFNGHLDTVGIIHILMWAVLAGLWLFPNWFMRYERYRGWGDGAFLIPFLSLQWLW